MIEKGKAGDVNERWKIKLFFTASPTGRAVRGLAQRHEPGTLSHDRHEEARTSRAAGRDSALGGTRMRTRMRGGGGGTTRSPSQPLVVRRRRLLCGGRAGPGPTPEPCRAQTKRRRHFALLRETGWEALAGGRRRWR